MIEIRHLTKLYDSYVAIEDISFAVESGRIYGLLGPNGAGKSTTMNIITGCLSATAGEVIIGGFSIHEQPRQAKKLLGYLPEHPPLYPEMTPQEYLRFVAKAKEIPSGKIPAQVEYVIKITQIDSMRHRLIRHLSKGYQQRIGIAQSLLGDPQFIILDEPMVGLDPMQISETRDLLLSLKSNHAIILSSHILSEIQAICDHVFIISGGKLLASDTLEGLKARLFAAPTVHLLLKADESRARAAISKVEGAVCQRVENLGSDTVQVEVVVDGKDDAREQLFFALSDARLPILEMATAKSNLEDVFLEITKTEQSSQPAENRKKGGQ